MKGLHIPIVGLMSLVLVLAVGFAAFRSGSETWFRSLDTATIGI